MAGGADKRARAVRRRLAARGFVLEVSGGGHYRVRHPDAPGSFSLSATPRSVGFEKVAMANAKRLLAGAFAPRPRGGPGQGRGSSA